MKQNKITFKIEGLSENKKYITVNLDQKKND